MHPKQWVRRVALLLVGKEVVCVTFDETPAFRRRDTPGAKYRSWQTGSAGARTP